MVSRRLVASVLLAATFAVLGTVGPTVSQAKFNSFSASTETQDEFRYPTTANGRSTDVPFITAYQLNGESVEIDGKLNEPLWDKVEAGTGFRIWDPDRGEPASEETVFKVAYDADAIYFAVACLEKDPSNVTSNLARRDRFSESDLISIYIDPYHDKLTGYNFKINPEGVKIDAYMFNDGDSDQDWNAVWDTETYSDEHGWYAEVRIPFSVVRFRPSDNMTWGLQVYRYMHGRGEDTAWVIWDRETRGFTSRFGELRGLREVPAPRQLEILPYALTKSQDYAVTEAGLSDDLETTANMGADLKYGVSADLTLNATVQPDFGQVEADPATLNLSPFETFFQEKRPFFVEGARFFQHPDFNLFYSRRIGTGHPNSRIRAAGKLTGKTKSNLSMGWLAATTDVTSEGKALDFFKSGYAPQSYVVGRIGKEYNEGNYKVNFMGTAAVTHGDSRGTGEENAGVVPKREAYTGGFDFDINMKDRAYNVQGSVVYSNIQPQGVNSYTGTGGSLDVRKVGGKVRAGLYGRWESDRLDLNDVGFLSAPDEINHGMWASYRYNPEGKSKIFNLANSNFNLWNSYLYGGRAGTHIDTGEVVWAYQPKLHQRLGTNINGWMQFRNYYEAWWGLEYMPESRQRYETRGGPLMTEPTTYGGWWGAGSDSRKVFSLQTSGSYFVDTIGNNSVRVEVGGRWNVSNALRAELSTGFNNRTDDSQWLENVHLSERSGSNGVGIGGESYVFGGIHQQTLDVTLRSSYLFTRDTSVELYLQPFVTVGDYRDAKELETPDTYDFLPYEETRDDGTAYQAQDFDFTYASVNLNLVYRWEFRPGSTFFLVWTHNRTTFEQRGPTQINGPANSFNNDINTGALLDNEGANVFMAKMTYWFNI